MNVEQIAIEAGVLQVDEQSTKWTNNNAIEVLDRFAYILRREQMQPKLENANLFLLEVLIQAVIQSKNTDKLGGAIADLEKFMEGK